MTAVSIREFYREILGDSCDKLDMLMDDAKGKSIGHFNVFNIAHFYTNGCPLKATMPYNRRTYYKISLISGRNRAEYADKVVEVGDYAVLFATPKIPYTYVPLDEKQGGHFCVFTKDFLAKSNSGLVIEDVPIFKPGSDFIYQITKEQFLEFEQIFNKMHAEINSEYEFKYDLLRNYVIELIHYGQKLKPVAASGISTNNASARIASLFIELLERQFPIESPTQILQLRAAKDYADMLRVHVNHLNKVLREVTGKTTTEIITSRIAQEARILLKQTRWNVSEIAYSLGFEEVAHFSNFFKKQTGISPVAFRE